MLRKAKVYFKSSAIPLPIYSSYYFRNANPPLSSGHEGHTDVVFKNAMVLHTIRHFLDFNVFVLELNNKIPELKLKKFETITFLFRRHSFLVAPDKSF